jgi:hypothetical protein
MKLTRRNLRNLILEEFNVLLEQEEEGEDMFGGEDEGGDEEAAEDEGGDEEPAEDEGGDEEAAEDEGGEEGEEVAEPVELDLEPGEEAEFTKTIDDEINAVLIGFESDALKSAQVQGDPLVATDIVIQPESKKWYRSPLAKVLYEQDETPGPLLDVEKFASEVSRLVINYVNLLDMESHIVNKAKLFLLTKYDEATVEKFEQILDQTYGIALDAGGGDAEVPAPVALGSGFASAPGGA